MTRRRFAFWLGLGLFSLAEKLHATGLDALAAAIIRDQNDPKQAAKPNQLKPTSLPEHWVLADNKAWWWYERQNLVDGQWSLTGITTPINKQTGEIYTGTTGYLDTSLVPSDVLTAGGHEIAGIGSQTFQGQPLQELGPGQPDPARRARHGRPPSKWLRSLYAEELRIWLKTIDVPEADVSGMSFWTHLTRDHAFDPENITGLTVEEQAQLHAAAHFGY